MKKDSPPPKPVSRDAQLSCYVTPDDSKAFKEFARNVGFKSTSHLMTAIVERLVIGGFAPAVFLKVGMQIQRHAEQMGRPYKGKPYNFLRPLPALPEEYISPRQFDEEILQIRKKLFEEGDNSLVTA